MKNLSIWTTFENSEMLSFSAHTLNFCRMHLNYIKSMKSSAWLIIIVFFFSCNNVNFQNVRCILSFFSHFPKKGRKCSNMHSIDLNSVLQIQKYRWNRCKNFKIFFDSLFFLIGVKSMWSIENRGNVSKN